MRNFFYIIATICALAVSASGSYYFLAYLPGYQVAETLAKNQSLCNQLQDKAVQNFIDQSGGMSVKDGTSGSNHFNLKLQKCFVEVKSLSCPPDVTASLGFSKDCSNEINIRDALENVQVADCRIAPYTFDANCVGESGIITKSQFDQLERQYMNE